MNLPKQITLKKYLHMSTGSDGIPRYELYSYDLSGDRTFGDHTCLGKVEVVVDVPQVDPVSKMIDGLERQIATERAASQARISSWQEQISQLRCLEYKPEGTA